MQEIFAGLLTAVDVVAVYTALHPPKRRVLLASWTAFCHMLFPFIGYLSGEWLLVFIAQASVWISSTLLFLTGLQLCLNQHNSDKLWIHPAILALFVSFDTFSVSLSFGMLQVEKWLFIISAGLSAFVFSYIALSIKSFHSPWIMRIAGIGLMAMGITPLID